MCVSRRNVLKGLALGVPAMPIRSCGISPRRKKKPLMKWHQLITARFKQTRTYIKSL